jgi:peptide/nickel transport system substrate-binding protein
VVVRYPDDLFETVKWHDGSPLSAGDFVMFMILAFDPAKPESYIYDEGQVPGVEGWMSHFKGVRIVSTDPLVIETYDDAFQLDAEISVLTMNYPNYTWFPWYSQGPGAWHNMAAGIRADANKDLAFSATKADTLQVDWMNFISGPSLDILKRYMDLSAVEDYLPYAPTMGLYVTPAEIKTRWANLQAWYAARGHFWLGTGPFYLEAAYPVEGTVTLQRFADFPDPVTKWSGFSEPKLSTVEVDGPGRITLGTQATLDVYVTFKDKPYPQAEIGEVKYLLFDTEGKLVTVGVATVVKDGQYEILLSADQTNQLQAGSNTMEVAVVSKMVSIPSFASFQFVTSAP